MKPLEPPSRRHVLRSSATGFGWLALAALHSRWSGEAAGAAAPSLTNPLAPREPHFPARAKRVILLFMNGGPSHHESFDHKPELTRFAQGNSRYLAPVFPFSPRGRSGLMISDAFPHLAAHADDLCLLNGMRTKSNGHQESVVLLHTGNERFVRPSMGSWIVYGLGSDAEDLPGFITINPIGNLGGAMNYGSAFLPATFQGTRLGGGAGSIPDLHNRWLSGDGQRRQLDFIQSANRRLLERDPGNPELEGVIQSYEMAYKMQTSIPETLDLSQEPPSIQELYGLNEGETQGFGTQCLMARRLAEKGVRFIQLTSNGWDHHNRIREGFARAAASIDKPVAGLLADLKQRDLLKDTLVIWGGEFGRGAAEDNGGGRGHNGMGFTMWMAGGGVKGGHVHGATDELGAEAVDGVMTIHDLHATILHLLGLNHERLTFRYAGRKFRLTDTEGIVAQDILA